MSFLFTVSLLKSLVLRSGAQTVAYFSSLIVSMQTSWLPINNIKPGFSVV